MKAQAFVGNKEVDLNEFVEMYVANVFAGVANSLRGVKIPRRLEFTVHKGDVTITADGTPVELAGFAKQIVTDTVNATLKHLKGLSTEDPVKIVVQL